MLSVDDRMTIINMVARADDFATARDAEGYVTLFSETAVIVGAVGDFIGRDAIRAGVQDVWASEADGTHHLSSTITVSENDDGSALARSTLLLVAGSPPQIASVSKISQKFVNTTSGWRIVRREILL